MNNIKEINEVNRIIKRRFFRGLPNGLDHWHLCFCFRDTFLNNSWKEFWDKNCKYWTKDGGYHGYVGDFLSYDLIEDYCSDEYKFKVSLLRLLVVEDFKQYLKEQRKNDKSRSR